MKYSVKSYAQAFVRALENPKPDHGAVVKNFLAIVERNGDGVRLKKILDEAGRLARGKNEAREVVVESARPLTGAQKKTLRTLVKPNDIIREKIDPALVAGIKIIVNDEMQFDGTLKAKLDSLFT